MRTLENIVIDHVSHEKVIEVLRGDLTEAPDGDRFDVLVVSAFPNDYAPTPSSLIGALHRRGVSVEALSRDREYDLRTGFSCWLSKPIPEDRGLAFDRVLCFEPEDDGQSPADRIDDIFRALAPFLGLPHKPVTSVAMPLLACGDQATPVADMAEPLIRAAAHWMRTSPLHRVRIVERDEHRAGQLMEEAARVKQAILTEQTGPEKRYDVFLSYCQKNREAADHVVATLKAKAPGIRIFRDVLELVTGSDYRVQLDRAVRESRRFLPLLTPEYVLSKACQDEFNAAWSIQQRHDPAFFWRSSYGRPRSPTRAWPPSSTTTARRRTAGRSSGRAGSWWRASG